MQSVSLLPDWRAPDLKVSVDSKCIWQL